MTAQRVLIINGPIASGKSTVAQALAAERRRSGSSAAVVDLDLMYAMLHDGPLMSDPHIARLARRAAAVLVDQYIVDGIQLVIVEGDFWTSGQRDEFTQRLASGVAPVFVTLRVSVEEALRRVELDTNRRLSRIPEVLRRSHADFAASPQITGDVVIHSCVLSVAEVAARIRSVLDAPTSSSRSSADTPVFVPRRSRPSFDLRLALGVRQALSRDEQSFRPHS